MVPDQRIRRLRCGKLPEYDSCAKRFRRLDIHDELLQSGSAEFFKIQRIADTIRFGVCTLYISFICFFSYMVMERPSSSVWTSASSFRKAGSTITSDSFRLLKKA